MITVVTTGAASDVADVADVALDSDDCVVELASSVVVDISICEDDVVVS